jgi:hypothetical protein
MDTSELEMAYRSVLDLAKGSAGSWADAGDDEGWRPDDVLAHLIVNDRLLARAVRSVLDGAARPYDNLDAIEVAELRAVTERHGGAGGLIAELEASSRELLDLAGRLDDRQGACAVPVRILDGEVLRVDQPLPVASLLTIQARRHLPMHTEQLNALLGRP